MRMSNDQHPDRRVDSHVLVMALMLRIRCGGEHLLLVTNFTILADEYPLMATQAAG